jgi:Na+/H+-dicarboxylate symporter
MSNQSRIAVASDAAKAQIDVVARRHRAFYYIVALLLGTVLGLLGLATINNIVDFIATAFTRMFSFLAVPVIALSLINTLSSLNRGDSGKLIFRYTIFYTILTTILAACVEAALFILIAPANVPSEMAGTANVEGIAHNSYLKYLLDVIPNNIIQPFVSGNVLSILLIAAAVGLGLAALPESRGRTAVKDLLSGLQELFFLLIHYLVLILPVAIVAFTAQLIAQIKAGIILGGIAQYFTAIIGANLLQFFVILPIILLLSGLNPIRIFKGMLPALAVALFSKSSAATLPVTIASAEDNLNINKKVSRSVLPICTTINMNGCAAFILISSLYLVQNAGILVSLPVIATWVFIATFAAIGNAGVPMGCYFLTISLVSSMGIPVAIMGVILPVYTVIDMIETSLNVWSDSCVANIVNKKLKGRLE